MRKRSFLFIGLAIALIIVGAIILCLHLSDSTNDKNDMITIEYWTHTDPARNELEAELIEEFERLNPNIKVVRTIYTSSEILNILPNALSAGHGPDVFNIQQDYLGSILENGYTSPIDPVPLGYDTIEDVLDDYIPNSLAGSTLNGIAYGIPMEFTNWCLYINKARFKEVGLDPETDYPKTWEEMMEISELLVSREDGILIERGFDFRYPHYLTFFLPMVQQLGGSILNEDNELELVNENAWVKAFTFMQDWGPLGKNLGSPTYINARTVFSRGESAMMLSGLYQIERFSHSAPEFYESDDWMIVPFPVFEGGLDVAAAKYCLYWCVNSSSDSETQKAGWQFIGHLAKNAEAYLMRSYLLSPKKELMDNLDSYDIPYMEVFKSDLNRSEFVYSEPNAVELNDIMETLIKEVMLLGLDPEKAMIRLKIAIEALSI